MEHLSDKPKFQVSAFYQFVRIEDPVRLKKDLEHCLMDSGILGTVLVAHEGVNGTICGKQEQVVAFISFLAEKVAIKHIPFKVAFEDFQPFHRMKVKLKKEIVTLGVEGIDPLRKVGTYVKPKEWNELISRDDVLLVDTRNDYEYQVGTFLGAKNPNTNSFRQFPEYVEQELNPEKHAKVAMFCTGGIRCEKATALMIEKGFQEVYHLEGGILEYFNQIPEEESLWDGECFVFDDRVTVNQRLKKGDYELCHACRMPLTQDDLLSDQFEKGISCPNCFGKLDEQKLSGLKQRHYQMTLAKERNEKHLGNVQCRHQSQFD